MFDFFLNKKNKKIETENIRNYNDAIKTIKYFIAILDWDKANKAIEEILEKELQSYINLLNNIDEVWDNVLIEKEKQKIIKAYKKKQKQLNSLKNEINIKQEKYNKKREKERFEIRFKTITNEINKLSETWKSSDALKLLSKFLEENPGKKIVIDFYNKEKKKILKQRIKEKEKQDEKYKQNAKLEALKLIWKTSNLDIENNNEKNEKLSFIDSIKDKLNLYKNIKKKLENKKLLDEITLLIEEEDKVKNDIASSKLENMHKWLIKEIENNSMLW